MGGAVVASALLPALENAALAAPPPPTGGPYTGGYGPLSPLAPVNEPGGTKYLALPAGFSYVALAKTGTPLVSDPNTPNPVNLDGMGAFGLAGGRVRLIRNSEDRSPAGSGSVKGPDGTKYDPKAFGGVTVLDFDPKTRTIVNDYIGLNGTTVNCAGGQAYRYKGWITCEETVVGPANGFDKKHGYVFLVPAGAGTTVPSVPLTALGRFSHEAVAVDQRIGVVYLTEDSGSGRGSGFYRFIPKDPDKLEKGGLLQILAVTGRPQVDLREGQRRGVWLPVEWVDIDNPDPDPIVEAEKPNPTSVFAQGWAGGAAKFNRLEGIWAADYSIFFASTSGGDVKNGDVNSDGFAEGYGQIWQYQPAAGRGRRTSGSHTDAGRLRLVFESPGGSVLDSPDNITITPQGSLLLCEDDAGGKDGDTHPLAPGITDVNRLIGLTQDGKAFEFAVNCFSDSEWAGACFSPDGQTLFANVFGASEVGSGFTAAITGPWRRGVL
ncbi:alkaline phosphatase PhoX [Frankia sp. CcWB3]